MKKYVKIQKKNIWAELFFSLKNGGFPTLLRPREMLPINNTRELYEGVGALYDELVGPANLLDELQLIKMSVSSRWMNTKYPMS